MDGGTKKVAANAQGRPEGGPPPGEPKPVRLQGCLSPKYNASPPDDQREHEQTLPHPQGAYQDRPEV